MTNAQFTVQKAETPPMPQGPVPFPEAYVLYYTKTVKDVNGKDVVIPDRQERVTLDGLKAQAAQFQTMLDDLNAKIESITALGAGAPAAKE